MKFSFDQVDGIEAHYAELAKEWIKDIKKFCKVENIKLEHGSTSSVYIYGKFDGEEKILSIRDHENFSASHPLPDYSVVIKIGTSVATVENTLLKATADIINSLS